MNAHPGSITRFDARVSGAHGLVTVVGLAMLLVACAPEPSPAPVMPVAPVARPRPQATYKPVPAPKRKPATPEPGPAVDPSNEPPPEPPEPAVAAASLQVPSTADLIGLDQPRAIALLGPATGTDVRGPATVWHFRGAQCQLDLVFYMEMKTGRMRTLHANFSGDAATPERRRVCLASIMANKS